MTKFPLRENIFIETKMNQIDSDFDIEKVKILNFIKNENKGYLIFINQTLVSFKEENVGLNYADFENLFNEPDKQKT